MRNLSLQPLMAAMPTPVPSPVASTVVERRAVHPANSSQPEAKAHQEARAPRLVRDTLIAFGNASPAAGLRPSAQRASAKCRAAMPYRPKSVQVAALAR